ncbi:MAG: adenylyltransferase/cytidyltransferase family protein [Thermoplasmata archaeon]
MVRVMASGVFDLIHLGHIHYLQEAKKLGDELIVVVARDSTVRREKHEPITPEEFRRELVESLKPVDRAVLGGEGDMFRIVEEIKPDIIALGYDQSHDAEKIAQELKRRGLEVEVVRLGELDGDLGGTRKIIKKVVNWFSASEKLRRVEEGSK